MKFVYIIQSTSSPEHFYTGITDSIDNRLAEHNQGKLPNTARYKPWKMKTFIAFNDEKQAFLFEKYLKSASGRAFAKKRL